MKKHPEIQNPFFEVVITGKEVVDGEEQPSVLKDFESSYFLQFLWVKTQENWRHAGIHLPSTTPVHNVPWTAEKVQLTLDFQ